MIYNILYRIPDIIYIISYLYLSLSLYLRADEARPCYWTRLKTFLPGCNHSHVVSWPVPTVEEQRSGLSNDLGISSVFAKTWILGAVTDPFHQVLQVKGIRSASLRDSFSKNYGMHTYGCSGLLDGTACSCTGPVKLNRGGFPGLAPELPISCWGVLENWRFPLQKLCGWHPTFWK